MRNEIREPGSLYENLFEPVNAPLGIIIIVPSLLSIFHIAKGEACHALSK